MKIMRKYKLPALIALCLAAILVLSSCAPTGTGKKASNASGVLGENITWEYDASTKTLTVSGNGDMKALTSSADIPWAAANMSAETLIVEDGILSICDYAFYGFGALKTVALPEGLTSIGKLSFAFCGALETISFPSTLTSVGESAFEWCASLKSINVGSRLTALDSRAFAYCRDLASAYLCSEGLVISDGAFLGCELLSTVVLHTADKGKINASAFDEGFDTAKISYDEAANDQVTVTVNYVTIDGEKMIEPKTHSLKLGDPYSFETPSIEGFSASAAVIEGVAGTSDETFTVIYSPTPVESESESESESDNEVAEPEINNDGPGIFSIIILVIVIAGIGVGAYFLVKSNKKEAERQANQNKAKNRKQK